MPQPPDPTELTRESAAGNRAARDGLFEELYGVLRKLASKQLRSERPDHTLRPTELVHEAYVRLVGQRRVDERSRTHLLCLAARMMRRVLADHARRRRAVKRGGGAARVTLSGIEAAGDPGVDLDVFALHEALAELESLDPRQALVVELRLFAGQSVEDVARELDISPRTVKGDWRIARAWLQRRLSAT